MRYNDKLRVGELGEEIGQPCRAGWGVPAGRFVDQV
jgi:hypothetical protein